MLKNTMNLKAFPQHTKEIQTINFTILLGQEDERSRRRCSVNRGYIPKERDPPRLRDRVAHGCGVSLEQALSSRGLFIYGRDLCATEIKLNTLTVTSALVADHTTVKQRPFGVDIGSSSRLAAKLLPYPSTESHPRHLGGPL